MTQPHRPQVSPPYQQPPTPTPKPGEPRNPWWLWRRRLARRHAITAIVGDEDQNLLSRLIQRAVGPVPKDE